MTDWRGIPLEYRDQIVTGDCRELARALPDESVDLILTDPPYGVNLGGSRAFDDTPAYAAEMAAWIANEAPRIIRPGCYCVVFQSNGDPLRDNWALFPRGSRLFVAGKSLARLHPGRMSMAWEPAVYWRKDGPSPGFGARDYFIANTSDTLSRDPIDHPRGQACPKPLDMVRFLIERLTYPGGVVADFCAGSGTTAVAARQLGRSFVGFEIDPETATLARERVRLTPEPLPGLEMPDPQLDLLEVP